MKPEWRYLGVVLDHVGMVVAPSIVVAPASSWVDIYVGFAIEVSRVTLSNWDFDGGVFAVSNEGFMAKGAVRHERTRADRLNEYVVLLSEEKAHFGFGDEVL